MAFVGPEKYVSKCVGKLPACVCWKNLAGEVYPWGFQKGELVTFYQDVRRRKVNCSALGTENGTVNFLWLFIFCGVPDMEADCGISTPL